MASGISEFEDHFACNGLRGNQSHLSDRPGIWLLAIVM
jgi:hypothetical protein